VGTPVELESLIQMPSLLTGVWRRFAVHVFEGAVTTDDMDLMETHAARWHRSNPGKVVELVVIFPSNTRMSSEERTKMASFIKRWEHTRAASATVILATGLLGAMHRSVLTGMLLFAPPPHPTKVFGEVLPSIHWITPHVQSLCAEDASRDDLQAGIEALCTRFRSERAAQGRLTT
jgi:hypothetical protein